MTKEEFIEKAKKVHGDKYDYSKVKYVNNRTKVCIICPEHGEFWQTPNHHLQGHGCKYCKNENIRKRCTHNITIFIEKARKVHGDKYDYSKVEYINSKTKVCIICPIHGEFWQVPSYHLSGNGCPECGIEKRNKHNSLNKTQFIEKARKVHGDKYDYSKVEYVNSSTKVCIICPEHGEFWQTPNSHLRGGGCSKCGINRRTISQTSNIEMFIKKAREIHGDKYDYSKVEYINNKTKVCIICPEHREFWMKPNAHLNGQGCPLCGIENGIEKRRKTIEIFIEQANNIHNNKYDYSKVEYVDSHTKVCIICPEHGEFWQMPNSHLSGVGCPVCKSSKLELKMLSFLNENHINFIYQARQMHFYWLKRQSLDFYLPDYNIAIECQGKQHFNEGNFGSINFDFEKIYGNDVKKKNKCEENNIKLFYYTEYKNYQMFDIYNKENTFTNLKTFKKKILDKYGIFNNREPIKEFKRGCTSTITEMASRKICS